MDRIALMVAWIEARGAARLRNAQARFVTMDSTPDQRKDLHDIQAVLVEIKDILAKR